jgi:adenylate cyclase
MMTSPRGYSAIVHEIERTYLLDGMPALPYGTERLRIEQGYLPERDVNVSGEAADQPEGRLRRMTMPDGAVELEHVVKRGSGLVRSEDQFPITPEAFERLWPLTQGRRISKTRYRVACDDGGERRVWEVDAFDDLNLVLAEVELPHRDAKAPIPDWLRPHIVREVTEEKQYRNYELALRLAAEPTNHPDE